MSRIKLNINDIEKTQVQSATSDFKGNGNWKRNYDGSFTCKGNKGSALPILTLREEKDYTYTLLIDFNPSKFFYNDNLYEYCISKNHIAKLRDYIESKGIRISLNTLLNAQINYCEFYRIFLINTDEKNYFLKNIFTNLYKPQNEVYRSSYSAGGASVSISTKNKLLNIYDKTSEISKSNPDILKDLNNKNLNAFKIELKYSRRKECSNLAKRYFNNNYLTLESLIYNPDLGQRIIKNYWIDIIKTSLDLNNSKLPLLAYKIHKDKNISSDSKILFLYFLNLLNEYGYAYAIKNIKKELSEFKFRSFIKLLKELIEKYNCNISPDIHALTKRLCSNEVITKDN